MTEQLGLAEGGQRPHRSGPHRVGMQALTHPALATAIAILLLNDHVLKSLWPSPLTGKLSDIAGLIFFPALVIVVLGWALRGHLQNPRRVAGLAFLGTGIAFAALKGVPPVNAGAHSLAALVPGLRLQLSLDPTDLWALAVLPPALLLWLQAEAGHRPVSLRAGVLSASVAALAAIATAPCPPEQPISRFLQGPDGVYAVAHAWDPFSSIYLSRDLGRNWEALQESDVPTDISAQAVNPVTLPVVACLASRMEECYRIDGVRPQIERSEDGGSTWDIAWSPPASRLSYMSRVAAGTGELLACGKEIDFTPHDLMLLEQGGRTVVLVALGNEGVLRGQAEEDTWERLGVGWAEATPERASSLEDLWPPSTILTETFVLLGAAAIAFLAFSIRVWVRSPRRPDASGEGYRWYYWLAAGILGLVVLAGFALNVEELLLMVGTPLAVLLAYGAFLGQRWSIVIGDSLNADAVQKSLWVSLASTFGCAAIAWLPFVFWIYGVIASYALAFGLALAVVAAGWLWGWRRVRLLTATH